MRIVSLLALLCLSTAPQQTPPPANNAPAAEENPQPWRKVLTKGNVTVFSRQSSRSGLMEVRAEAVLDLPLPVLKQVVGDVNRFHEFMPYVKEAFRLEQVANGRFEYLRIAPPFIQQRDYTLQIFEEDKGPQGHYVRRWTIANDKGPPPRSGAIRLNFVDGSWTLTAQDGGKKTHLVYWVHSDPGGSLPSFIVNMANNQSLPDVIRAVHKRGQQLHGQS